MVLVSPEEIRAAMFYMGLHKVPGLDGYNVEFFKGSRDIVGDQVMTMVTDFCARARLHREANMTIIALVRSKTSPLSNTISCSNLVYKCITHISATHIQEVLPGLIGSEQSMFIPGRRIIGYDVKKGNARCALKIDIRKAYDSVE